MGLHREKLRVLYNFLAFVHQDPAMTFLLGLLAGAIGRVHFVRSLEGAPVAVQIAVGRARVWPQAPFKATVRGVNIPEPAILGSVFADSDDPICLRVVYDGSEDDPALQALLVDNYLDVIQGRPAEVQIAERRVAELRAQIDRALDVYNECLQLLRAGDPARREEVRVFLRMAEQELQSCSRELRELEKTLDRAPSD